MIDIFAEALLAIDPVDVEMRNVSEANKTLEEMKEGKLLGLVALNHD